MAVQVLLDILNCLSSLIVNRGKLRFLPDQKSVDANGNDVVFVFQQSYLWQEYLVGYSQPWDQ